MDEQTNQPPSLDSLTPRQIVEELDRYVIGQRDAKRMVAIALRTRWRRQRLPADLRSEVHTSELQSRLHLVCRLLLEKKKKRNQSSRPTASPILVPSRT